MNPSDCYNIHWPIVRGQLNVHTGPGGSLTAALADLETIWGHVIQKQLDIPLKDLKVGGNTSFALTVWHAGGLKPKLHTFHKREVF